MKTVAESGADGARSYRNDFIRRTFMPWLQQNPRLHADAFALMAALDRAAARRKTLAGNTGVEIPETLAVGLTSRCSRRCPFCCMRNQRADEEVSLPRALVERALDECERLGISRIALVGGEPFAYPGVAELIAGRPELFFTVFTNGLEQDEHQMRRLQPLANQALIVNISASEQPGQAGLAPLAAQALMRLRDRDLFFGFAATVHRQNARWFQEQEIFLRARDLGARFGVLFDYLPGFEEPRDPFVVDPEERAAVVRQAREFTEATGLMLLCAPEDEAIMGGCAAAGRLVLHLSARGILTPCPFVPFSRFHISRTSLLEALESDYFRELRGRSREWEKREGACAYRAASQEVAEIGRRHGVAGCPVSGTAEIRFEEREHV
jgi:MoaA/NifB/PqqE/SkfB family radical SAM enzyme